MKRSFGLLIIISLVFINCSEENEFTMLQGPYLGQVPPGMTAELFDPGIFPEGEGQG